MNTPFYIILHYRNVIESWSANPIVLVPNTMYDFTTAASKVYGNNQIEVAPNIWAFYSGDIIQDGAIDAFDYLSIDPDITLGNSGYIDTDLNGDGVVDAFDYLILDAYIISSIGMITL